MSSSWNPPDPWAPPARHRGRRRPVRRGLLFGVLMVVAELVAPLLPAQARPVTAVATGSAAAWLWALFAGWLGRGGRTWWTGALMGATGLLAASFVRNVADAVSGLVRGASPDDALARLMPSVGFWVAGPLTLGLVAGVVGHLTTRGDAVRTSMRRQAASGPDASHGAPEAALRRYSAPTGPRPGARLRPPAQTRPLPAQGQPRYEQQGYGQQGYGQQAYGPPAYGRSATTGAPTQDLAAYDAPTEQLPAVQRTPVEPAEWDEPTRANPTRWR